MVALSDDAQNRLMVDPATLSGNPAASADHRAISPMPSCAGLTQPAMMSSMPMLPRASNLATEADKGMLGASLLTLPLDAPFAGLRFNEHA